MISDFWLDLWFGVFEWAVNLLPDHEGLPAGVVSAVEGTGSFFSSTGDLLGALNDWFPVTLFLSVVAVGLAVEVAVGLVLAIRKIKQLLPFQ